MPTAVEDVQDVERCYRAVRSRDRRFDGVFYTAVRTTGIYCRPSCPAVTPKQGNVQFYASAAAAQLAGYRACRRCLPDATPGSPQWDLRADVAGRAVRLINDGVVEREGVGGLAARIGYTARHLGRVLVQEVGAGPLALSRARRAQLARTLLDTSMPLTDVAFAAGFSSVRQFNATIAQVYAATPTQLRAQRSAGSQAAAGRLRIRLGARAPFDGRNLVTFLSKRAVPGVEHAGADGYSRTLDLPHGPALVHLCVDDVEQPVVLCDLQLGDLRDLPAAVERCRRLLDLDCDPVAVAEQLGRDVLLAPLVRQYTGLRVAGSVDGTETAVRTILGQQVSEAAARALTARLVRDHGKPLDASVGAVREAGKAADGILTHLFPQAATLAAVDPTTLAMPQSRARAVVTMCTAIADGRVVLDRSADRSEVRAAMLALPGIGPWTADGILMRALGDPDVFLPTDAGLREALRGLGHDPARAADMATSWQPWRSYALTHLWTWLLDRRLDRQPSERQGRP